MLRSFAAITLGLLLLFQGWTALSTTFDLIWTQAVYQGFYHPIPLSLGEESLLFRTMDYGFWISAELLLHIVLRGAAALLLGSSVVGVVTRRRLLATASAVLAMFAHLASHGVAFLASLAIPDYASWDAFLMTWEPIIGGLAYTLLELSWLGDLTLAAVALAVGLVCSVLAFVGSAPPPAA